MKNIDQLILAVALASLPSLVNAETFSYTSVSVDYQRFSSTIDGISDTVRGSGVSFDLSISVGPNAAIIAKHTTTSASIITDGNTVDAVIKSGSLGFLIHAAILEMTDLVLGIRFINGKADVEVNDVFTHEADEDGGASFIGLRTKVSEQLELNGFLRRWTIQDASRIRVSLGAAYYFVESASIDLDYSLDSDSDLLSLGVTAYF